MLIQPSELKKGFAAHQAGRLVEARQHYEKALEQEPQNGEVLYLLGIVCMAAQQIDRAIALLERCLKIKPAFAIAYNSLGNAFQSRKEFDRAIVAYRRALECEPPCLEAYCNLGAVLKTQNKISEAVAVYREALAIKPDYVEALCNLGAALKAQNKIDAAIAAYQRALEIKPDLAEAHNNLGNALRIQNKLDEAIAACQQALKIKPDYAEAYSNLGTIFHSQRKPTEAIEAYSKALAINPDYPEAHFNEGLAHLLTGNLLRGWQKHEYRWKTEQRQARRNFKQPLWLGAGSLKGKSILLYAEQGMGDTLQLVRYIPLVAELGATIYLEVQAGLKPLLSTLSHVKAVYAEGEVLPNFDVQCPLLSLPLAFSTDLNSIPAVVPYIRTDAGHVAKWRTLLEQQPRPRIGVAWFGNRKHKNDHNRSIPALVFERFVRRSLHHFLCLQKDLKQAADAAVAALPQVTNLSAQINDFSDTAAIVENLDLVITVDTSIVHLAGALGKPTWVLLPFTPDWRWLLDRSDSPWYPTVRLFRQSAIGDWDSVLREIQNELDRTFSNTKSLRLGGA